MNFREIKHFLSNAIFKKAISGHPEWFFLKFFLTRELKYENKAFT